MIHPLVSRVSDEQTDEVINQLVVFQHIAAEFVSKQGNEVSTGAQATTRVELRIVLEQKTFNSQELVFSRNQNLKAKYGGVKRLFVVDDGYRAVVRR